jgi:hypothetical protein
MPRTADALEVVILLKLIQNAVHVFFEGKRLLTSDSLIHLVITIRQYDKLADFC